jgi:hypothetical protein
VTTDMNLYLDEQLLADRLAELRADAARARLARAARHRPASEPGRALARREWRARLLALLAR